VGERERVLTLIGEFCAGRSLERERERERERELHFSTVHYRKMLKLPAGVYLL
jgi:hypothetical protein